MVFVPSALFIMRLLSVVLCAVFLSAGMAVAQESGETIPPSVQLDSIKAEIDQIEAALDRSDMNDAALVKVRDQVTPLKERAQTLIEKLQPQLQALDKRLEQFAPEGAAAKTPSAPEAPAEPTPVPPAEQPAEGESIPQAPPPETAPKPNAETEHTLLKENRKKLDDNIRRGRAIVVQAEQILDTVTSRRRALFQSALFAHSRSIVSPELWMDVAAATPRAMNSFRLLMRDWGNLAFDRLNWGTGLALLALLSAALLLAIPGKRYAQRMGKRFAVQQVPPSRLRRSGNALWVLVVNTSVPTLTAVLLYYGLKSIGFLPQRLEQLAIAMVWAVFFVSFVKGLSKGILSPNRDSWRLAMLTDDTVKIIRRQPQFIALVFACGIVLEKFWETLSANLAITIANNGVLAIANAITFATGIYALRAAVSAHNEASSETKESSTPLLNAISIITWAAIIVVLAATLIGYIGFARFLAQQIIWLALLGTLLYVLLVFTDDFFTIGLSSQTRFGQFIHRSVGLRAQTFDLLNILMSGVIRFTLVVVAMILALAPWGLNQSDTLGWVSGLFRGFSVAGLTISPSTILGAIAIFAIGMVATRLVQSWLRGSFLPHTRMDSGLQNSIITGFGYFGIILAGGLTMSAIGLGLDKIALVAGALSVGIGFGLQSIVNNFVSGLILLAGRPIKVGDWIALGPEEGNVRKISVRSTEIELFNRSTLIVPNSELISQKVVNRTMTAGVGRVLVDLITAQSVDVDSVRDMLMAAAEAHPLVLESPAPSVSLGITETGLKFSLFCFVPSPRQTSTTASELNFAIFKEIKNRQIALPGSGPDMNQRVLLAVEQSLKVLASAPSQKSASVRKPRAETE